MTNSVDLASLFSSQDGISLLYKGSSIFGISVFASDSKINNCVDYGVTTMVDWQPEFSVPIGYEQLKEERKSRIMNQVITISHQGFDQLPVIISDVQVLPRDSVGRPVFSLTDYDEKGNTTAKGITIHAGNFIKLNLQCTIPEEFQGFLGR